MSKGDTEAYESGTKARRDQRGRGVCGDVEKAREDEEEEAGH